uniref:RNase H type-1 domain-containing protein n=1 Tax=viral metagenome TaxID=1070528 RepID=A0A6C0IW82_9ZZZZ
MSEIEDIYQKIIVGVKPLWSDIIELHKKDILNVLTEIMPDIKSDIVVPPIVDVFNAFKYVDITTTKIVIIGQDPYQKYGEACGLSFGTQNKSIPPSLKNINKALEKSFGTSLMDGDLTHWAKQGILLLNSRLTTVLGKALPKTHAKWELITNSIIKILSEKRPDVIYMLWGGFAQKKTKHITQSALILKHSHPSPMGDCKQPLSKRFINCTHFVDANEYLISCGKKPIKWVQVKSPASRAITAYRRKLLSKLEGKLLKESKEMGADEEKIEVFTRRATSKEKERLLSKLEGKLLKELKEIGADDERVELYMEHATNKEKETLLSELEGAKKKDQLQKSNSLISMGCIPDDSYILFTDGACSGNGKAHARASWAYYIRYGDLDRKLNSGEVAKKTISPSNNRGELLGIIKGLSCICKKGKTFKKILIVTDSKYSMTVWKYVDSWIDSKTIDEKKNPDLTMKLYKFKCWLIESDFSVDLVHIRSHKPKPTDDILKFYWKGNQKADELAQGIIR